MTKGTVFDINTGRRIGEAHSMTDTMLSYIDSLLAGGKTIYVVTGTVRHKEYRRFIDAIKAKNVPVIFEYEAGWGNAYIFEGTPDEWEEAKSGGD